MLPRNVLVFGRGQNFSLQKMHNLDGKVCVCGVNCCQLAFTKELLTIHEKWPLWNKKWGLSLGTFLSGEVLCMGQ